MGRFYNRCNDGGIILCVNDEEEKEKNNLSENWHLDDRFFRFYFWEKGSQRYGYFRLLCSLLLDCTGCDSAESWTNLESRHTLRRALKNLFASRGKNSSVNGARSSRCVLITLRARQRGINRAEECARGDDGIYYRFFACVVTESGRLRRI